MEPTPRSSKRIWIAVGVTVVGIVLAVVVFRVVTRSGSRTSASSAADAASPCGCAWSGTTCVGAVCELAPKATWTLVPLRATWAAASGTPAAPDLTVCTRATGSADWKCTKPMNAAAAVAAGTQHVEIAAANNADGTVVVTTEALKGTGIDIEIRRGSASVASGSALHHATLRPAAMLFQGGLRFGDKQHGLNDVLYRFSPTQ